jgi:multiple sugar transport system substrate-binding protein
MRIRSAIMIASLFLACAAGWGAPKITLIHYHWTETTYDPIIQKAVKAFEAKHPNVEVKVIFLPDADRANVVRTVLASNGDIDSFALSNGEAPEFYEGGQMLPIIPASFGKKSVDEVVKMWNPGSFETVGAARDGAYYGIPFELSNFVAWINTADMREAGLDPKRDIPKTWDDFAAVAGKLVKKQGGVTVRNGFMNNSKAGIFNVIVLYSIMEQLGLDWSTEKGLLASMDKPELLARGLRTYTDFVTKSKVWDPAFADNDREAFGNNKSATFMTGGTWYWGVLDTYSVKRSDVRPFAFPRYKDGKDLGGVGYGFSLFVSKLSKHPDLAFELLDTLASYPNDFAAKGLYQPREKLSNGSAAIDPAVARKSIPYYDEVFKPELGKTARMLSSTKSTPVTNAVWDAVSRVIFEGISVDDSVAKMRSEIKAVFQ